MILNDLEWAAGALDAAGRFILRVDPVKGQVRSAAVRTCSIPHHVAVRLHNLLGGGIFPTGHAFPRWWIGPEDQVEALKKVLPYMRSQSDIVVQVIQFRMTAAGHSRVAPGVKELRRELARKKEASCG